jgi:tRNA G18 (ribose-2'-O)-methylase SpoU
MTLQLADEKLKIPMHRLTKSYNISVTVALCIQTIITIIRSSNYN